LRDMDATCPACGGSGGGPFGPPGSVWDREDWMCPKCAGLGVLSQDGANDGPDVKKSTPDPALEWTGTGEK
jgi:hypothetical protein